LRAPLQQILLWQLTVLVMVSFLLACSYFFFIMK